MRRVILIIINLVIAFITSRSQVTGQFIQELYLSPAVTIGYTFRCGWNYGFDLTFGLGRIANTLPHTVAGLNLQFYVINYQSERHKITAFNFVVDNSIAQFGLGIGAVSKKWGYQKVNKEAAVGASIVSAYSFENPNIPWLGVKIFIPSNNWVWSSLPYYISYQFYWRQNPIIIH